MLEPVEPDPLDDMPMLSCIPAPLQRNKIRPDSMLEQKRQKRRENQGYQQKYLEKLESFKEMDVDRISNHRRRGNGRYTNLIQNH